LCQSIEQGSSPGLQRIVKQQSAEISRLYDRLRNKEHRDSLGHLDRVDQIKSEDVRRLLQENAVLKRRLQEAQLSHEAEVADMRRVYEGKIKELMGNGNSSLFQN
jgi:hypothetical protein